LSPSSKANTTEDAARVPTLELVSAYLRDRQRTSSPADLGWSRSFSAGYADAAGKYVGGSEILFLVPYEGKLYAANGYWMDNREAQSSSQVLRLDAPGATWQQDLDTMNDAQISNVQGALFSYCLRTSTLKELHFTKDSAGNAIDKKILLAACSAYLDMSGTSSVSIFVKTSGSGSWKNSHVLASQSSARKTPRDAEVYTDSVTGAQRVFLLAGDFGVLSGAYDATADDIAWGANPEPSIQGGTFPVRALGLAQAHGGLVFSVGKELWRRSDGASPSWSKAAEVSASTPVNTEVGGIRGLSTASQDLIFAWTPNGSSIGNIFTMDAALATSEETTMRTLYSTHAPTGGGSAVYSLGGYNDFYPVTDPKTGQACHIFGFQQVVSGADPQLLWNGFYAGATYAVRKSPTEYYVAEVNGNFDPSRAPLVAPRTFALSPFAGEEGVLYAGGFDANFKSATNKAWIFKAGLNVVLGNPAAPSPTPSPTPSPASGCGVCSATDGVLSPTIVAGTAYGHQYTCQDAEQFMKDNFALNGCTIPVVTWPTTCCHGCNLCSPGSTLTPTTVAGTNNGIPYTCQDAWNYMQSPSAPFSCATAQGYWRQTCCTSA